MSNILSHHLFSGRLNRRGFFIGILYVFSTPFLLWLLERPAHIFYTTPNIYSIFSSLIGLLSGSMIIFNIVFFFSVVSRRFHDLGHSGAWSLLLLLILWLISFFTVGVAIIGPVIGDVKLSVNIATGLIFISVLIIIFLVLKKGSGESNQYGPAS